MLTKFARSVTPRKAGVVVLLAATAGAVAATLSTGGSQPAAPTHSLSAPAGTRSASGGKASTSGQAVGSGPIVSQALHHDTSAPLRTITPTKFPDKGPQLTPDADGKRQAPPSGDQADPVVQSQLGTGQMPSTSVNFDGVSVGQGGQWAPPDPNGAAGPNNYFEIVNDGFAIYTKTGAVALSARPTNTIFSGFGGHCQTSNNGDGTVTYDQLAGRWVVQQFQITSLPYSDCVAVSTTSDPTGSWNRYEFATNNVDFNDYPKLGVWTDAYYVTYNIFANGNNYSGPEVCAFDKAKMIAGLAATQQCFKPSPVFFGLLPASIDGSTPPAPGSPELVMAENTNSLALWRFHVDWAVPANSTLTGPTQFAVASYTEACNGGGTCIPQPGTGNLLDSLGDRLMYRLAYRNFGDHESLVVAASVKAGISVGMRWYEIRGPFSTPTVYQQSTYSPDTTFRWMGSVAMDHVGDMALGFAVSSASVLPGARYTGRLFDDPLSTMGQGESTLVNGAGFQTTGLTRWGDYTSMSVDPVDDCTFWYLGEYLPSNGQWNWKTRIGAFKFPSCTGGGGNPPPVVSSFLPTSGPVGTNVAVTGTGFTGATAVKFNGTAATTFTVDSDTSIHATVPLSATTGPISVTTGNGTGASATNYTVTTGGGNPPTVTSFTPTSGPVGTNVQITGTNFTGATGVTFNNTAALSFTVDDDTSIHATVPVGATTGPIAVANADGTGTSSTNFTVTTNGAGPVITSFSPTSGPVGTKVTVNGSGFTGTTAVAFNGLTSNNWTLVSDAQLTVYVPAGATTGPISITTGNGSGQSSTNFTVTIPPPRVTGFTPTSGRHGQSISILGSNFTGATTVKLGTTATTFTIVSDTKITAVVPTVRIGQYKWTVTNSAGSGTSTSYFRVTG